LLPASVERIDELVGDDALVLDVGGWASPLRRADWVIDLMPYETRGRYGHPAPEAERFTSGTWVQRDICARDPWPFDTGQFDFAVCSHTLEDVRDPVWVCSELSRVARAGYVEIPSRLEEQCFGVHGPWVGWSHHRWLIDLVEGELQFVHKPHMLCGRADFYLPAEVAGMLTPEERVEALFWEGEVQASERVFIAAEECDTYMAEVLAAARRRDPGGPASRALCKLRRGRTALPH